MDEARSLVIGFIGCGVMGGPMAGHLVRAGHRVLLFNRTAARAEVWAAQCGGHVAASPAEAADGADAVISCVGNDDDVQAVTLGQNGAFAAMAPDSLYIDHSTISARLARQLSVEGDARGLLTLDAPVSGGQSGAEGGTLSIMCGGGDAAFARAQPIMAAYAARMVHMGGPGTGQSAKMANQMAIAGVLQGLAEAMHFAERAGLDRARLFEAISGGAAASWQMTNRWETMAEDRFDFGFAVDWMRKDLALAMDEARSVGAAIPLTALVDQFYADVQRMGGARWDTSALVRRLRP